MDDRPLRVLVVTVVHDPLDARILRRQIRAMSRAGWRVTYAAPWTATSLSSVEGLGIDVVTTPRAVGRRRFRAWRAARRILRDHASDHDLVLIHDPDLVPVALSVRSARPLIWDVHEDTAAALSDRGWVPGFALRPVRWLVRRMEAWMDHRHVLLLAEESYRSRFQGDHPVVRNVPWAIPRISERRTPFRVVYVGRLSKSRGLPEMIELGQRLGADAEVLLVGDVDAADRAMLEAAVEHGDVVWTGRLPNERALAEVAGAVAGLSLLRDEPNFHGSMPTKVLEYLGVGVPVISTPLPLAVEVLQASGAGFEVPFGDVASVERTVRELLADPDRWESMSRSGHEFVDTHYSWDREAHRFLDALSLAAKARA